MGAQSHRQGLRFAVNPHDYLTSGILALLTAYRDAEEADAARMAIGAAIKQMSIYGVLELRMRIHAELNCDNPTVQSTLEMIDGQVALREIGGPARWR